MTNPFDNPTGPEQPPRGFTPGPQYNAPRQAPTPSNEQTPGFGQRGTAGPASQPSYQASPQAQGTPPPSYTPQQPVNNQQPNFGPGMPQQKSGSKKTLWIVLAIIGVVILAAALAIFFGFKAFKGVTEELPAGSVSASDDAYWDRTIPSYEVDSIRDSVIAAPVPEALTGLTAECYEDTSYFGASTDLGFEPQWVPTIACLFGDDQEFTAQYTENADAIAAAEAMGLSSSFMEFKSLRGSVGTFYTDGDEGVVVEVLGSGDAVIEYVMEGVESDQTGQIGEEFMQKLSDAGFAEVSIEA